MKKVLLMGIVATLLTIGASAQSRKNDFKKEGPGSDFRSHQLTRGEKAKIHKNSANFHRSKHKAFRDGKFSHKEKKNLYKMKKQNRHDVYRFRHNDRRRS